MTEGQFMDELAVALNEPPAALLPQTALADLKGWDSMGILGVVALLDSVRGEPTEIAAVQACRTCQDVLKLANVL
jgi:hypothetical protein